MRFRYLIAGWNILAWITLKTLLCFLTSNSPHDLPSFKIAERKHFFPQFFSPLGLMFHVCMWACMYSFSFLSCQLFLPSSSFFLLFRFVDSWRKSQSVHHAWGETEGGVKEEEMVLEHEKFWKFFLFLRDGKFFSSFLSVRWIFICKKGGRLSVSLCSPQFHLYLFIYFSVQTSFSRLFQKLRIEWKAKRAKFIIWIQKPVGFSAVQQSAGMSDR